MARVHDEVVSIDDTALSMQKNIILNIILWNFREHLLNIYL